LLGNVLAVIVYLCLFVKYFLESVVEMHLRIAARDANFNQPANSRRNYPLKITHGKTPAVRKCSHLMFKVSCSCSHTSLKSLLPLQQLYWGSADPAYLILPQFVIIAPGYPW